MKKQTQIGSTHTVGHGVGLEMENALDLNMSIHQTMKHGGGSVMIWRCMVAFGSGAWYKIEDRMHRHLDKFILENFLWSIIYNYNVDLSRLVYLTI